MIKIYIGLVVLIILGMYNRDELWGFSIAFATSIALLILGCFHFDYNLKEDLLKHQCHMIYKKYGYSYTPLELYLMDGEINNLIYLEETEIKIVE